MDRCQVLLMCGEELSQTLSLSLSLLYFGIVGGWIDVKSSPELQGSTHDPSCCSYQLGLSNSFLTTKIFKISYSEMMVTKTEKRRVCGGGEGELAQDCRKEHSALLLQFQLLDLIGSISLRQFMGHQL